MPHRPAWSSLWHLQHRTAVLVASWSVSAYFLVNDEDMMFFFLVRGSIWWKSIAPEYVLYPQRSQQPPMLLMRASLRSLPSAESLLLCSSALSGFLATHARLFLRTDSAFLAVQARSTAMPRSDLRYAALHALHMRRRPSLLLDCLENSDTGLVSLHLQHIFMISR